MNWENEPCENLGKTILEKQGGHIKPAKELGLFEV
jgi:hypothetical protein